MRLPKFLGIPLLACHSLWTPEALHILTISDASVLTSVYVKTLVNLNLHFEAVPTLRVYGYPYGLQDSLCTLRLVCSQHFSCSAADATLDTGGWLDLTGQGLSPCKVHQASLGALTTEELADRIKYDPRTIRERLKDSVLLEGVHYIRPFGGRKILYLWEAIQRGHIQALR